MSAEAILHEPYLTVSCDTPKANRFCNRSQEYLPDNAVCRKNKHLQSTQYHGRLNVYVYMYIYIYICIVIAIAVREIERYIERDIERWRDREIET